MKYKYHLNSIDFAPKKTGKLVLVDKLCNIPLSVHEFDKLMI